MDRRRNAPDRRPFRSVAARPRRIGRHRFGFLLVAMIALLGLLGLAGCSDSSSAASVDFEGLTAGQRVYDLTGTSLSASETAELQRRLNVLRGETGADVQ